MTKDAARNLETFSHPLPNIDDHELQYAEAVLVQGPASECIAQGTVVTSSAGDLPLR